MKTYLFLLYSFISFCGVAQNLQGMIKYRYKTIEHEDGTKTYNIASYLYFSKVQSLYVLDRIKDMEEKDKLERKYTDITPTTPNDTLRPFKRKRDNYGQQYFIDNSTKKMKSREFIERKPFTTEEPIPQIKWQILSEGGKKIGKYNCQKARTVFRGRTYEAWFTMEIPLNIGPWKLQGLPGAILEAKSQDGKVAFEAEEIHIPFTLTTELTFNTAPDDPFVPFEEYKKLPEKQAKKEADHVMGMFQAAFMQNGINAGNMSDMKYDIGFRIETQYE
jgi:GLPGLI family protein